MRSRHLSSCGTFALCMPDANCVHAWLVCVSILHEIYLRDVSPPISFRNGRHHDHRSNALICLCLRYHKSRQIPLIWPQLPRNSNTRYTEHAIPSLVLQHSRNSRSPFHTVWSEKDRGTRSLVMSHIDTAQHSLVSGSHCIVLTTGLKCTDSPNSTTGRFQVFPHRR